MSAPIGGGATVPRVEPAEGSLSLAEVRCLVRPHFEHRPFLYWVDLMVSAGSGWAVLALLARASTPAVAWLLLVPVGAVAFLRAVLFIHEISHFRRGVMRGFTAAWDLLVGIPLCLPSFMYDTHTDHHKRNLFGTIRDPEYAPLAWYGRSRIALFVIECVLVPALLVVRFGVLGPLSWLVLPLRRLVVGRMSALVINPAYVRKTPRGADGRRFLVLEAAIAIWLWGAVGALVAGLIPWRAALGWYSVAALVAVVNQVRTLAAHGYENDGRRLSTLGQLLDSINVRGSPLLTELVFPVGLRYHALHHYLPDVPYHELGRAHRVLMRELPPDSPYRRTERAGLGEVVSDLWRRAAPRRGTPPAWTTEDSER